MKKLILAVAIICACVLLSGCSANLYSNAKNYTAGGAVITDSVRNIEIYYTSGSVTLLTSAENTVTIEETCSRDIDDSLKVHWWLNGDTLIIHYAQSSVLSLIRTSSTEKQLTVTIPADCALENLTIESASAAVEVKGLIAYKAELSTASGSINIGAERVSSMEIDSASGSVTVSGDTVNELDIKTASGSISASFASCDGMELESSSGSICVEGEETGKLKAETASGNVNLTLKSIGDIDIDTASGRVNLGLPEDASFTMSLKTASGELTNDFAVVTRGEVMQCADGKTIIKIKTASGDVTVRKLAH